MQNLLNKKAALRAKKIEYETGLVKEKLLEKLKTKEEENERQKEIENQSQEIINVINEQFKQFKLETDIKPKEIEKKVDPKVVEKFVEKPSKYSSYSDLYNKFLSKFESVIIQFVVN